MALQQATFRCGATREEFSTSESSRGLPPLPAPGWPWEGAAAPEPARELQELWIREVGRPQQHSSYSWEDAGWEKSPKVTVMRRSGSEKHSSLPEARWLPREKEKELETDRLTPLCFFFFF